LEHARLGTDTLAVSNEDYMAPEMFRIPMISKIKIDMFRVQSSIDIKNHQVSNIPEIHGFGSASNKTDIVAPKCNRFFQHQTIINTLSVLRLHLADRPRKFHIVISFSVPLCGKEK